MTDWQRLLSAWNWEPSVVLGCIAIVVAYAAALHINPPQKASRDDRLRFFSFVAGVLVLLLSLVSPLDILSDVYLFSAHMVQHLLMVQIVPLLMLLGISPWLARRVLAWPTVKRIERVIGQPVVAWALGMGTLAIWHLPALYSATLRDEQLHTLEHLMFLISATIFWWPVITPVRERRLAPLLTMLYLAPAAMMNSLLGIVLAFSRLGSYSPYLHPVDALGILPLIRIQWGLSPGVDQQVAGELMWIPGSLAYLGVIIAVLTHWYSELDTDDEEREPAFPSSSAMDHKQIVVPVIGHSPPVIQGSPRLRQ